MADLLNRLSVLSHPLVIGELACGRLENRDEIFSLLSALPMALVAEHDEVLLLLDDERLYGRGLGWVDVHLLASARLTVCALWTLDKPLAKAAGALDLSVKHRKGPLGL